MMPRWLEGFKAGLGFADQHGRKAGLQISERDLVSYDEEFDTGFDAGIEYRLGTQGSVLNLLQDNIRRRMDQIHAEHHALPGTIFGGPRKRHHQIMGENRALLALSRDILNIARTIRLHKETP